ncbi:monovalent cation/H+ antiporter complex subunit F [Sulfuriroseicoccus oceanibius]|uniref:Cation:proton antiporter n=1 Tax=Sulfuriroseicoccus oceanibius TaxID=2707525 RepID=A0A6B3LBD1_9BACT|nr:monovalent cation/H+ antiporter complex subunit F [Sulfuriroseicoccus oceanibius]QQL45570.1 hypothetical protein G3M56_002995 [Sulfuriroseicoccus oceanibius]
MLATASVIIALALFISLMRLLFTPAPEDKVIVIDIAGFQLLGLAILLALHDRSSVHLQFAFILALLGFLSTVILSRLIKHQSTKP